MSCPLQSRGKVRNRRVFRFDSSEHQKVEIKWQFRVSGKKKGVGQAPFAATTPAQPLALNLPSIDSFFSHLFWIDTIAETLPLKHKIVLQSTIYQAKVWMPTVHKTPAMLGEPSPTRMFSPCMAKSGDGVLAKAPSARQHLNECAQVNKSR